MGRPSSIINICSGVMLDKTYKNTIWFDDIDAQREYFEGKVVKTFSSYSYLRREWDIQVQATMEQALSWTYLFFKNDTNHKTYYYFINKIEYVNENCVKLFIEMDVMQTYAFDYNLARSFVEREHVASDDAGDNVLDEGLDLGELYISDATDYNIEELVCLVLASFNPETTTEDSTAITVSGSIDGVFSGLGVYAVEAVDFFAWRAKLESLDEWGKSDGIISMWMYPKELVRLNSSYEWGDDNVCKKVAGANTESVTFNYGDDLDGYTPRNQKLLTYPYNFMYVTNNTGSSAVYHFERFGVTAKGLMTVCGAIAPDGACKLYPKVYNGKSENYEEGILLSGYPSCAWNQDVYKLWLAQNQNQQSVAMTSANLQVAGGAVTGVAGLIGGLFSGNFTGALGGAGMMAHGMTTVADLMAQKKDMSIQPPQSKGGFSANVNIVSGSQTFTMMRKHVTRERAAMLDEYFDMYGYKCNRVKIPNRNVRQNWTYTKTVGCNVYGNLCADDLAKIANIFDEGVTFWTQGDLIGNYGMLNNVKGV